MSLLEQGSQSPPTRHKKTSFAAFIHCTSILLLQPPLPAKRNEGTALVAGFMTITHAFTQFSALRSIVALALIGVASAYVAAPLEARAVLADSSVV